MKNLTIASVLTNALILCCAILSPLQTAAQGDQQKISVSLGSGATSGAWLHLPDDYSQTSAKYPLIVFLHGLGEKGTDLNLVLRHGVPKMIAKGANMQFTVGGKLFKFIVVSPQIPNGWASEGMVQGIINDMKKRYRIDESRIYLTGLSAGGYGVLNYVGSGKTYSDNLAAIVPVSTAAIDAPKVNGLCNVAASNVATWMLCGTSDGFIDNQKTYVDKINSCSPAIKAIGTSFAGGHDGGFWDKVYDVTNTYQTPNIYEWMLQYSRDEVPAEPGPDPEPEPVPDPVVSLLSSNISLQLPTASTTLDGSASTAPNSTIQSYAWEQKSGPSTAGMTGKTTSKAVVNGLLAGTYVFSLTVTNAEGQSSSADVTVQVAAAPATGGSKACSSCKFLIIPGTDGGAYINGNNLNAQPGDTICVQAGNYTYIQFFNFTGSSEKPLVFINCGGQVRTGSSGNYGLIFSNCKYFKVTGSGSSDKYGFYTEGVTKHTSTGVAMGKGCTDYEAERIEITRSEAGIMAKINPDCDPESQYPNFAIRNVKLHDLYIHDVLGEGMYIGNTAPNGSDVVCDGVTKSLLPPRIYNLKIYNVITENTGWDGIQVASAPENVEIFNNSVYNFGTTNKGSQQAGIILGGESNGKVYNNKIIKGTGNALEVFGIGTCYVFNNIISDAGFDGTAAGQDALFIDDRPTDHNFKPLVAYVFNNTVVNSKRDAIRIISSYGTVGTGNLVYNNLVVNAGSVADIGNAGYINIQKNLDFQSSNNVTMADINAAGFVNAAGKDFHLSASATSSIDKGKDLSAYFKFDFDEEARPQGSAFDVGADEYSTGGTANKAPVARAGNDITITLPVSTASLDGSASNDPDGSISAYKWEFVDGPETATLTNATAAKATAAKLTRAGTYTFRLTVTDNKQATATDEVKVIVKDAAAPPVVNAGSNITIRLPVSTATLSGTATAASGSTIASYTWAQISGPVTTAIASPATANTTVSKLTTAGSYAFRLTAKDNNDLSASDTVIVTVENADVPNTPPVVNAGNTINVTLPVSTAQLTGTATPANGSTIASYTWMQISGPVAASIATPNAAVTSVSQLTSAGTYSFKLTANDNNDLSASDTVNVVVAEEPASNTPPVVNAGNPATITLPVATVTLTGTAKPATGSTVVSYAWTEVAGPGNAEILSPAAATTIINGLTAPGTYTFRLTAKDSEGLSASDEVTVQVLEAGNIAPVSRTGPDQAVIKPKNTTFVDGSASSDEDGTIVSYHWVQISGPSTASIVQPDNVTTDLNRLTDVGTYVFRLTVTDNKGATAVDLISVEIKPAPPAEAPVADAGVDQQITLPVSTVTLDASGSHGVNAALTAYTWEIQAGPSNGAAISNAGAVNPSVTFTLPGTYTFRLTVKDSRGATASDNVTIQVLEAGNIVPVARTGPDQVIEQPGNTTFVDGSASSDEDGTIVSYHWVQISGPSTATIVQPDNVSTDLNRLTDAGVYVFRLTVTDNRGATAVDLISIEVKSAPVIEMPVADAGGDQEITLPIMMATLDASRSHAVNSTLTDFTWEVQSGPSNGARINNDGAVRPSVVFTLPGTYIFRLTVTDANNNTATDQVTVIVHEDDAPGHDEEVLVTATPNPVVNNLRVQISLPAPMNITIRIVNSNGALIANYPLGSITDYQKYIDVGGWAKGLYLIHVTDGQSFNVTKKIVKVD